MVLVFLAEMNTYLVSVGQRWTQVSDKQLLVTALSHGTGRRIPAKIEIDRIDEPKQ